MIRMVAIAAAAALALGAVACGGDDDGEGDASGAGLVIHAENIAFSPDGLVVPVGEPVRLTLVNLDPVEHDFQIDDIAVDVIAGGVADGGHGGADPHGGENVLAVHTDVGETASVTFRALEAGSYEFYCTIPGHRESGMTGTLSVE